MGALRHARAADLPVTGSSVNDGVRSASPLGFARYAGRSYAIRMVGSPGLVGRERERQVLDGRFERAAAGEGGLLLLAGEAGVGKTSMAETVLAAHPLLVLQGMASEQGKTPYAPIVTALRAYDRIAPGALGESGRLSSHLAVLLPELGQSPEAGDSLALAEALRAAFSEMADRRADSGVLRRPPMGRLCDA